MAAPGPQRHAALALTAILEHLIARVHPGVSPAELASASLDLFTEHGIEPVLHGHAAPGIKPFPAPICVSVNDASVNGVPPATAVRAGDVLTIDAAGAREGWHADAAATVVVTETGSSQHQPSLAVLGAVLGCLRPGADPETVLRVYRHACRAVGWYPVREAVLHGIGRSLHAPPFALEGREPTPGDVLVEGQTVAVEPVIASRAGALGTDPDGWTRRITGGGVTAYEERTVVIGRDGVELLTPDPRFPAG